MGCSARSGRSGFPPLSAPGGARRSLRAAFRSACPTWPEATPGTLRRAPPGAGGGNPPLPPRAEHPLPACPAPSSPALRAPWTRDRASDRPPGRAVSDPITQPPQLTLLRLMRGGHPLSNSPPVAR